MEQRPGKTTHAQRNLFGPVDHEQLWQDFQHMLYNSVEGVQQKGNFDFLWDVPAEGLLQWEELKSQEVPTFYHSSEVISPSGAQQESRVAHWMRDFAFFSFFLFVCLFVGTLSRVQ
uniref:Cyclin-dependent kinase inhibitor domain-containing protein n=1 Tax=Athene cunicularia TaxID=194338 RepID=A0A663M808_ATHCN